MKLLLYLVLLVVVFPFKILLAICKHAIISRKSPEPSFRGFFRIWSLQISSVMGPFFAFKRSDMLADHAIYFRVPASVIVFGNIIQFSQYFASILTIKVVSPTKSRLPLVIIIGR